MMHIADRIDVNEESNPCDNEGHEGRQGVYLQTSLRFERTGLNPAKQLFLKKARIRRQEKKTNEYQYRDKKGQTDSSTCNVAYGLLPQPFTD